MKEKITLCKGDIVLQREGNRTFAYMLVKFIARKATYELWDYFCFTSNFIDTNGHFEYSFFHDGTYTLTSVR